MKAKVLSILALLFMLCLFLAVMSSDPWYNLTGGLFLKPNNIENLLRRTSLYGILGIGVAFVIITGRSEEHTSELQSRRNLVCRLLLEKKN